MESFPFLVSEKWGRVSFEKENKEVLGNVQAKQYFSYSEEEEGAEEEVDGIWTHLNRGFDGLSRRWAEGKGGVPDAWVSTSKPLILTQGQRDS